MPLVLTVDDGDYVMLGDIKIFCHRKGTQIKLCIEAPREVVINRSKIHERIEREKSRGY